MMTALERAAAKRRRAKIVFTLFLAFVFAAFAYIGASSRRTPRDRPILLTLEQLAPAAKKRDPFACGQALKHFTDNPKDTGQLGDFLSWCCLPEVDDMSGYVHAGCQRFLADVK